MPSRIKIFNDPVYGFISVPYGLLFDLIEQPYFQRLRRIKQVGLTQYVYPGALHTRFHHALGALHLTQQAIGVLRQKGIEISDEECEAVCIGILLHDIGHGPFSHALEHTLVNVDHERLSILFMEELNAQFDGRLTMAISIFRDSYHKKFLHQLVSSQLDMDRMDYLSRDSFYTGVSEGVISYDRLIKMLTVADGELVIEEKGIYSVEKFLIARRLMYWQVYLHKAALSAEHMLIQALRRAKDLAIDGQKLPVSKSLGFFLYNSSSTDELLSNREELLYHFSRIDDIDIWSLLKAVDKHDDPVLAYLASCILNRKLFRVKLRTKPFSEKAYNKLLNKTAAHFEISEKLARYLVLYGTETNTAYSTIKAEIKILKKSGKVSPISKITEHGIKSKQIEKHYLGGAKELI